ncbi:MAG: amidohydrolase family protein, partial [Myxococcota bacterium]
MDASRLSTIRGRLLAPDPTRRSMSLWDDALIGIGDDGRIQSVEAAPADCPTPETWPDAVILPGFVDAHVHYPQTRVLGSASGPLLPWLASTVFPEEARFSDAHYAAAVAEE